MAQLQPGDPIFFAPDTSDPQTIFHVGTSLGGDRRITAPQAGDVVKIEEHLSRSAHWAPKFIGGIRPWSSAIPAVQPHQT